MSLLEKIKDKYPLEDYIGSQSGMKWKNIGSWKTLEECPFCHGHGCFRLSPDGKAHCFQCCCTIFDSIKFRSLYEGITYKDAIDGFRKDMGIKKYEKKDIEWVTMKEEACAYMMEVLFTCETKYQMRDKKIKPLHYLTDIRKHSDKAILNFRIGFNDGGLIDHLKSKGYSEESIKGSKLDMIPEGCFAYPFIINNEIGYYRIKDPNKIKKWQMPIAIRPKNAIWFNQDIINKSKDLVIVEGEDDVISLWDAGINAIASYGTLTISQVNYLKDRELSCVYLAFDSDPAGEVDTKVFVSNYIDKENLFLINIPKGEDIDDLLRESENPAETLNQLKQDIKRPNPELMSIVSQEKDGYYITKSKYKERLTNWTLFIEAVIIRSEDERLLKVTIRSGKYETPALMPAIARTNVRNLREFVSSVSNKLLFFIGVDNDLANLVQYWDLVSDPKIVIEADCVGEIAEGFIAENIFISNAGDFLPLTNGFLSLDDKKSIRIKEITVQGGKKAGMPYFPLVEPVGGINNFKTKVYDMMVKNRNLKIALAIGWLKATIWSKMFFDKYRFFPLLMFHGKYQGGKTNLAEWLRSFLGLRNVNKISLPKEGGGGTTGVGIERSFDYYSSLPVQVDDYKDTDSCHRFDSFFNNVFDRTSSPKGVRGGFGVRMVNIRGCLLLTGENSPNDPGLLSRFVSIEITEQERTSKYYNELVELEPQFACIGLQWIKDKDKDFEAFISYYESLSAIIAKRIKKPRQAACIAVALAGAMTEPYFEKKEKEIMELAVKLTQKELEDRKGEEVLGTIWDAVDVLHKRGMKDRHIISYDSSTNTIAIFLSGLLAEIKGNQFTRHYHLPNKREVAKILRQEPYALEDKVTKIDSRVARRWILDFDKCPENLKNLFSSEAEENKSGDDV